VRHTATRVQTIVSLLRQRGFPSGTLDDGKKIPSSFLYSLHCISHAAFKSDLSSPEWRGADMTHLQWLLLGNGDHCKCACAVTWLVPAWLFIFTYIRIAPMDADYTAASVTSREGRYFSNSHMRPAGGSTTRSTDFIMRHSRCGNSTGYK